MNQPTGNPHRPGEDLWLLAADKLDKADRQCLDFDHQDKLKVLSDLQALTLRSRDECIEKRWRFRRKGGKGETIILRDLFSKLVVWVEKFIKIGDNAIQYDPGHATLPWAGVRFLLQIAVNDIEKFDFVVEGAEMIAHMIDRYAIYENLYLINSTAVVDKFRDALVHSYATIINYLASAKKYYEQKTTSRVLKSVILADDFEPLSKNMILAQSKVEQYADLVDAENSNSVVSVLATLQKDSRERQTTLTQLLNDLDEPISRISNHLKAIEDNLDSGKRTEILRWLSSQPYLEYHNQNKKDVLAGTGKWLLSEPSFMNWKNDSASSLLWLHGMPGSGKSKLVSIVIEDAMNKFKNARGTRPVYFYCSRNTAEPERANPTAILASIVRQLSSLEPGLPILQPILQKYQEEEKQAFPSGGLQIDQSCDLVIELASLHAETIIVLDALDECDLENRYQLLGAMEAILDRSNGLIKIFASSRDDDDIVCELQNYPNLKISSSKNSEDIDYFVRTETEQLVKRNRLLRHSYSKNELKDLIVTNVINGADGMFRWAGMQLEALCLLKLDEEIRSRLGKLPKKLSSLYQDIYDSLFIHTHDTVGPLLKNIFTWLLCAQINMDSSTFLAAISLCLKKPPSHLKKEDVLRLAHNFVDYDEGLDVFRFAHLSVREFLEKLPEYSTTSSNALAAETCLLTLIGSSKSPAASSFLTNICNFEDSKGQLLVTDLDEKKFASSRLDKYAMSFWGYHCITADRERAHSPVREVLHFFLFDESGKETALNQWISSYRKTGDESGIFNWSPGGPGKYYLADLFDSYPSSLAIAFLLSCHFGFCEVIETCVLKRFLNVEITQVGLELAAKSRQSKALVELLRIDENIKVTHNVMMTIVCCTNTEKMNAEGLLPMLLDRGGDLCITGNTIIVATSSGLRVMQLLVERCDPRQITETVLRGVASCCSKEMMDLLLNARKDAEITDDLMICVVRNNWNNREEVFSSLLEHGGEITEPVIEAIAKYNRNNKFFLNVVDDKFSQINPPLEILIAAVSNGTAEMVQVLLSRGGIVTAELVTAGATNYLHGGKVMPVLLSWNESIKITEEAVFNALSNNGSGPEIWKAFLAYDRSIEITEELMIYGARHYQAEEILKLFTTYNSSVEITEDILKAVALNRHCSNEALEFLLDRPNKAKVSEEILIASTLVSEWVRNRNTRLLVEHAEEEVVTEWLIRRALVRCEDVVITTLLDRDSRIPITTQLLVAAANNQHESGGDATVELLLGRNPNIEITEDVFKAAAGNSRISKEMMMHLQDRSRMIEITEEVVKAAASTGTCEVLEMLLDQQHYQGRDEDKMTNTIHVHVPETVIIAAVGNNEAQEEMTRMLWDRTNGFQITEAIIVAILNSYSVHSADSLDFLLDRAPTIDKEIAITEAIVIKAAGCIRRKIVDELLRHSNITAITEPMLKAAATSWNGTLKFFLNRSDKPKVTEDVIRVAATSGKEEHVKLLLGHYPLTPSLPWLDIAILFFGVKYRNRSFGALVKNLISQGMDVDLSDGHKRTSLSIAAENGNKPTVQVLLEAMAHPESKDSDGRTPVSWAAKHNRKFVVQTLLEKCVPPLAKDNDGNSPSDIAQQNDHFKLARFLKGFDEKRRDFMGRPL